MSDMAAAIIGAILGFQFSAILFLSYALSRTRERLAKVEQRVEDIRRNGGGNAGR